MCKILYCVSTLKKCGPINVLHNIVKYLDVNKFKVVIVTLSPEKGNSLQDAFRLLNCKIYNLNYNKINWLFKSRHDIQDIIKAEAIDVIHSHGIRADYIISGLEDINTCSTLHNYPYADYKMTYGSVKGYLMAVFHLAILKKIKKPVACSESITKILRQQNRYDMNFIRNGIDIDLFNNQNTESKDSLKRRLLLPTDKIIIISVGHLSSRKDPLTIIKAFISLDKVLQDKCQLIFLGRGTLKERCEIMVKDNDNIKILGFKENVHEYLKASDFFISAALAEGLPNTVMEALASGLPCLLSDILPHREIFGFNKDIGAIFSAENSEMLKNELSKILQSDYNAISSQAIDVAKECLSAEKMSINYQQLYQDFSSE